MATASQKIMEIRFLLRMCGARMAAPLSDAPVVRMPHAAPRMEKAIPIAMPTDAHTYG
eukprot:gene5489-gene4026